jgi:hypothetical protein
LLGREPSPFDVSYVVRHVVVVPAAGARRYAAAVEDNSASSAASLSSRNFSRSRRDGLGV